LREQQGISEKQITEAYSSLNRKEGVTKELETRYYNKVQ
jgi:hypothetical protein